MRLELFRHGFASSAVVAVFALVSPVTAQTFNVEVDWLVRAGDHDHKPTNCEIDAVKRAFHRHGFTLNVELSNAITETDALQVINFTGGSFDSGEWAALENANRNHAAGTGWHYAVFGHNYALDNSFKTSSGLAELDGDEFLVSLASFTSDKVGTAWDRAGTFMHEFGHNLGLRHAGDQDESVVRQYKPNYASVMAYRYQLIGVRNGMECQELADAPAPFFHLDYSRGTISPLDENQLHENFGMGHGPVDWNCSNSISGVTSEDASRALNWCGLLGGSRTTITDYDDWSNISSSAFSATRATPKTVSCITADERDEMEESFLDVGGACTQVDPCGVDACGDDSVDAGEECDGTSDAACPGNCQFDCTCAVCGDDVAEGPEECDGTSDSACPGACLGDCTCPPAFCGNVIVEVGEECDTTDVSGCLVDEVCGSTCACIPEGQSPALGRTATLLLVTLLLGGLAWMVKRMR